MKYIVTHGYTAHYDEMLSVGLLALKHGSLPVHRRTATAKELSNKHIAVIDTGMEHNFQYSNWDHHQFPENYLGPDGIPDCAFSLLARDYDYERSFRYSNWYRKLRKIDARGGFAWAKALGLGLPLPREVLTDPVGLGLRTEFEKCWGKQAVPLRLVEALCMIVKNLEIHGQGLYKEVSDIRKYGKDIDINGARGLRVDFMTNVGMIEYVAEEKQLGRVIDFTVNRDENGYWHVHRVDENMQINFHALDGMSEVVEMNRHGRFVKLNGGLTGLKVKELLAAAIAKPISGVAEKEAHP